MKQVETYDNVYTINVDVQNDFCPGGSLAVTDGDLVVSPLNAVNNWVRKKDGEVIFTADWHPRDTAHFAEFGGPWPPHCIRYTAGAAFHNDLLIEDADTVAKKGTGRVDDGYSGYYATLETGSPLYRPEYGRSGIGIYQVDGAIQEAIGIYAQKQRKLAVIVGGLATDYCVKATVLDLLSKSKERPEFANNLGVFVVQDAIRAVDVEPGDGDRAIQEMKKAGAIFVTSEEVVNGAIKVAA